MSWAVKEGRTPAHSLERVARRDVDADRRRIRRALSVDEAERLLAVAREHGREAWYACALLAGLRKGDMVRLSWRDVDFKRSILTVVGGKHGGADPVPMHPKLVEILLRHRGETRPMPASRVFPVPVHDERRVADFTAAGIAIVDELGHVADLHSLRATCCTWLARAGVPVQIAKLVMRHRQAETTEKHYTKLGLLDATGAVAMLPVLGSGSAEQAATGTAGATAGTTAGVADRARDPIGRNPLSTLARPAGLEPTTLRSVV
ncbi:MAG: tyrosine-type recombinase/integrase [Planctomycetes bacterium]|nr:tyrosine-type recombinase/integrase [Planctomycetota bacterium]